MVPGTLDVKGTQILAKSLFKELRGSGYTPNQILSLSTELIDLVTADLRSGHERRHAGRHRRRTARAGAPPCRGPSGRVDSSEARSTEKRTAPPAAPSFFRE